MLRVDDRGFEDTKVPCILFEPSSFDTYLYFRKTKSHLTFLERVEVSRTEAPDLSRLNMTDHTCTRLHVPCPSSQTLPAPRTPSTTVASTSSVQMTLCLHAPPHPLTRSRTPTSTEPRAPQRKLTSLCPNARGAAGAAVVSAGIAGASVELSIAVARERARTSATCVRPSSWMEGSFLPGRGGPFPADERGRR